MFFSSKGGGSESFNVEFYASVATENHALLLISPGCDRSAQLLQDLTQLLQESALASLEVVNIAVDPDRARRINLRAVPWLRLGEFEFEGGISTQELRAWVKLLNTEEGISRYLKKELQSGSLLRLEKLLAESPHWGQQVLVLLQEEKLPLPLRLSAEALMEALHGQEALTMMVPSLIEWLASSNPHHRRDALRYLSLSGEMKIIPLVRAAVHDSNEEVAEMAEECLDILLNGL
ncbi:MAG: HEAT repeat domain-containing protein [Gammaproteobacteria bacterium]|nr:HEAT repeat domain-containing protein [Gammaproteobacteria bacterium]